MLLLGRAGAEEGSWLRAVQQTSGRGRQGRVWVSPPGNLYASTLVRLREGDPGAATLALVAAVALEEIVRACLFPFPGEGRGPVTELRHFADSASHQSAPRLGPGLRRGRAEVRLHLKWPNDVMLDGAKLSGILLERVENAVVVGVGVNLAHHPTDLDRMATSLAAHDVLIGPQDFLGRLAETFTRWVGTWRSEGLASVRARWLERAHPIGTALTARIPDGSAIDGLFDGLDLDGALILRLADGTRRVIHAADVFLI